MRRMLRPILLALVSAAAVFAQDKPVVALLDLTGDGVSEAESVAVTNLLMSADWHSRFNDRVGSYLRGHPTLAITDLVDRF